MKTVAIASQSQREQKKYSAVLIRIAVVSAALFAAAILVFGFTKEASAAINPGLDKINQTSTAKQLIEPVIEASATTVATPSIAPQITPPSVELGLPSEIDIAITPAPTTATGTKKVLPKKQAYKRIVIDLSEQRAYMEENGKVIFSDRISSGLPGTPTNVGDFRVWSKVRSQTMSGVGWSLPNVQYVMYFDGEISTHGTWWHRNFGTPMSHGCINMTNETARKFYNWGHVGMDVTVRR